MARCKFFFISIIFISLFSNLIFPEHFVDIAEHSDITLPDDQPRTADGKQTNEKRDVVNPQRINDKQEPVDIQLTNEQKENAKMLSKEMQKKEITSAKLQSRINSGKLD